MHTNRLAQEQSPYLLQHAHNPVDWYPWGDEAFEKARREDKPIFLSIGYSTCHWCHVMERESFEIESTAALVNQWFVPIKIDREERPDIDRIYMNYVQATTGSGGWPMSVWLTPDLKPFVGGTYFPPDNRYGRPGFPLILERIADAWKNDRERILRSSEQVMEQLRQQAAASPGEKNSVDPEVLDIAFRQLARSFDSKLGGFGSAPKFPRPSVYNFLLRYFKRTGDEEALDMVATTLIAMEKGGMNDQLGGGFHRYSVDEYWFVPHFEKMLYDQGQLVCSYLEAFQITGNEAMERAACGTLDYLLRDMTSPEGAFWSAEDADSAPDPAQPHEKTEGFFYVWPWAEVVSLVGEEHAQWFAFRYGMERSGNVRNDPHHEFTGLNILFQAHTYEETAHHFDKDVAEIGPALAAAERTLFEARTKRPRPHLDDKILTAWNGLAISAFAKAGAILNEPRYEAAARRAADCILQRHGLEGGLYRCHGIAGMIDDYTFFVQGLLDLFEATFEIRYLNEAIALTEHQCELLEDPESGGFFASAQPDAVSLMRLKDDYDGAEPSGNSIAYMNLLRLHRITGREDFHASAQRLIAAFAGRIAATPYAMPQMLAAIEYSLAAPREIVVAGDVPPAVRRALWKNFDPHRLLLPASPELAVLHPGMAEMKGPAVYVCSNFACNAPVTTEEDLLRLLE
jgi:uncharacterized protein YyaL (SSP411 family)